MKAKLMKYQLEISVFKDETSWEVYKKMDDLTPNNILNSV